MEEAASTVFRRPEVQETAPMPSGKEPAITSTDTGVEVPYTAYSDEKGHPYSVDYFNLGDTWDVFSKEVKTIESYIKGKIESGDIANSRTAVEKEIKAMEKMNNVKDEERPVVKMGVLASYIKFLNETKNIKRYAN